MKTLYLITARGGSKGIPGKNIKKLAGKPLIEYSIDIARELSDDSMICVSTDDDEIIEVVENLGLTVPFKRPKELATDESGSYEVIMHALKFYENQGDQIDKVVLLQPTSPLRTLDHIKKGLEEYSPNMEMLVGVKETDVNPYYKLFEEDSKGFLQTSKDKRKIIRRQDAPKVYEVNGALYIINVKALKNKSSLDKLNKHKFVMDKYASVDIDDMLDWYICELIIEKKLAE